MTRSDTRYRESRLAEALAKGQPDKARQIRAAARQDGQQLDDGNIAYLVKMLNKGKRLGRRA